MFTFTQRVAMQRKANTANVRPCPRITNPEQGHRVEKQGWDTIARYSE
jgi:hypothetical protein